MVRGYHTRIASRSILGKRRRAPISGRFKRRRITKAKRSINFTSQNGSGSGIRFRSKRVSRVTWRRMLWNNTLQKDHYRSNFAASTAVNTPVSITSLTVSAVPALRFSSFNFYTAGGGAIAPDSAQALPTFTGKITVRGGLMGCRITNTLDSTAANASTIHGFVYLLRTSKDFTVGSIPASISLGWDPTLIQDFSTKIGTIVYRKTFLLRDAESALVEYRLRTMNVDPGDYINDVNTYYWVIAVGNVDIALARALNFSVYYNLSFAADAV